MDKQTAEIVTFKLRDTIKREAFLALMQQTEAFVKDQAGFCHRQLSEGPDGQWTDYVLWHDHQSAAQAAAAFEQQAFAPDIFAAIAPDSANMRHETVVLALPDVG
ncbi:hypothetical protein [Phaeobacter sp.]|uniref:hypothetical protein n=1 Tax=Phaeobacter sp. TaxID=1902409 RepID=UPI0025CC1600|nr:hypothetical protein [Phaeobacter sp.]